MPGGDGTGPGGMGPMTGRAAGYCAGNTVPGFAGFGGGRGFFGFGRGRGFGGGGGWGRRNWYYATGLPQWARAGVGSFAGGNPYQTEGAQPDLVALRNQARYMEDTLDEIKRRINEMESRQASEG